MHWLAIVNKQVSTHKSKKQAIAEIALLLTNKSPYLQSAIIAQLRSTDGASTAYGREQEEIAKVFPCNCGSARKHEIPD